MKRSTLHDQAGRRVTALSDDELDRLSEQFARGLYQMADGGAAKAFPARRVVEALGMPIEELNWALDGLATEGYIQQEENGEVRLTSKGIEWLKPRA